MRHRFAETLHFFFNHLWQVKLTSLEVIEGDHRNLLVEYTVEISVLSPVFVSFWKYVAAVRH